MTYYADEIKDIDGKPFAELPQAPLQAVATQLPPNPKLVPLPSGAQPAAARSIRTKKL